MMDNLIGIYQMLRIRMIEEAIAKEYSKEYMRCPTHLSIGQEAISVGVLMHLSDNDYILSNHRAHSHYLAKGGSLKKMIAEIMGKETGCCHGRGGSMHLVDLEKGFLGSTPIVGGTIPVAVGVALNVALKNEDKIVVIFLGDGATETGVFSESINFAMLRNLPIIFVCENNFYSVYSPLDVRQSKNKDRIKVAEAHGLFAMKEMGNDVTAVWKTMKEALCVTKNKKIPSFIEFDTYRFKEHCGPNDDDYLNYRPKDQVDFWKKNCPIELFKNYLFSKNIIDENIFLNMKMKISSEIEDAFSWAKKQKIKSFNMNEEEKVFYTL